MRTPVQQLDLFGPAHVRQLQAENTQLQHRLTTLWEELETCTRACGELQAALERAKQQTALSDRLATLCQQEAALWKARALGLRGGRTADSPAPPTLEATLKQLLTLAHPDKWSQGQPAVELAHELAIAINDARAHLEGQQP